jgi:hypothetical protein
VFVLKDENFVRTTSIAPILVTPALPARKETTDMIEQHHILARVARLIGKARGKICCPALETLEDAMASCQTPAIFPPDGVRVLLYYCIFNQ